MQQTHKPDNEGICSTIVAWLLRHRRSSTEPDLGTVLPVTSAVEKASRSIADDIQTLPQELQDLILSFVLSPPRLQSTILTKKEILFVREHVQSLEREHRRNGIWPARNKTFKFAVIGAEGTGMKQLISHICHRFQTEQYHVHARNEEDEQWYILHSVHPWKFKVKWDRHPLRSEGCSALEQKLLRQADACFLVYSVTSRRAFDEVKQFYREWLGSRREGAQRSFKRPALFVVASKVDLYVNDGEVPFRAGEEFAAAIGAPFLKISSTTGIGIGLMEVERIVQRVLLQHALTAKREQLAADRRAAG